jgi:hypothetical protein
VKEITNLLELIVDKDDPTRAMATMYVALSARSSDN